MLSQEILFFFSALGVFNSFLLGIYLLFIAKGDRTQNLLLAFLILCISIRVGVSCIYFFDHSIDAWLIQLGLSANVLAGGFLFEFLRTNSSKDLSLSPSSISHLLGLLGLILIGGLLFPFSEYRFFWDQRLRYFLHGILTIYLLASVYVTKGIWKGFFEKRKINSLEKKQFLVFIAFLLTSGAFVISLYTNYVLGPILYSLIFYSAAISYYYLRNTSKASPVKYANKKISEGQAQLLIAELMKKMEGEQVYKKSNLKISDLAKSLHISTHQLSQLLNANLGKRFSDFVNEFRIKEAQRLLLENKELTIEAIAYEVGFNAKSSFYTTFKILTKQTPASFKASQMALKGSKL